ncbi:hypothetical protein [Devosia rhizoryzae]|uniref:PepSY domain-containing protein n=1 Tax=Devosia rhizoryzae TaxID=2774137 RepID=A0ABX7C6X1_9HYPH|nr:hypothetical protein [Devosia rhizoryzae]QQR40012.1 hypothetical protein JI748_03060 [Devosia rhizoryzae]
MKQISALAVCAVLALPLHAFAQEAATPATTTEATGAQSTSAATGEVDWEKFEEELQTFASSDINFSAESTIEIVPLSTMEEDALDNRDEYTVGIPSDAGDIGAVRELLASNSVVVGAIEDADFTVDDVMDLWINQEGTVTIFVDDTDSGEQANPA